MPNSEMKVDNRLKKMILVTKLVKVVVETDGITSHKQGLTANTYTVSKWRPLIMKSLLSR